MTSEPCWALSGPSAKQVISVRPSGKLLQEPIYMGSWLSTAYYMDVLREKIRTRASFTKILVNYKSAEESLINEV